MKITASQLREAGACARQVDLFVSLFGEEVELSREIATKHAGKFDVQWAAETLLTRDGYKFYRSVIEPHLRAYLRVIRLLRVTYHEAVRPYLEDHRVVSVFGSAEEDAYWGAAAAHQEAYAEAVVPHRGVFDEACAVAFVEAMESHAHLVLPVGLAAVADEPRSPEGAGVGGGDGEGHQPAPESRGDEGGAGGDDIWAVGVDGVAWGGVVGDVES